MADAVLTNPEAAAKLLTTLGAHRSEFTPEERDAYNKLRDAMVAISRGGNPDSATPYLTTLAKYVGSMPAPVAEKKEVVQQAPAQPAFIGGRSIAAFGGGMEAPHASATAPAPVNVPTGAPVPETKPTPAPEAASAAPQPSADVRAIASEIEATNASLNAFAHGKAFQWLNDPKTRYREYMTKLVAAREAVDTAGKGGNAGDLRRLADEVKTLAAAVRQAVGGGAAPTPMPSESAAPSPAASTAPIAAKEDTAPVETPSWKTVSSAPMPPAPATPPAAVMPKVEDPVVPQAQKENMLRAEPDPAPLNIEIAPQTAPSEMPEAAAEEVTPPPVVEPEPVPEAPEVPAQPEAAAAFVDPDVPAANPDIYSPIVEQKLKELLQEWLQGTGWLGMKKLDFDNPDWKKMAPLTVGEIMDAEGKGEAIAGLSYDLVQNVAVNLRKWGELYGISMAQHVATTIDEVMHRIVYASLQPSNGGA